MIVSHCLTVSLSHCLTISLSHCLAISLSRVTMLSCRPVTFPLTTDTADCAQILPDLISMAGILPVHIGVSSVEQRGPVVDVMK
jgi:hypothetical protein